MGAATLPDLSAMRYTALSMAFGALSIVAITRVATLGGFAPAPAWSHVEVLWHEIAYLSLVASNLAGRAPGAGQPATRSGPASRPARAVRVAASLRSCT